MFKLKKFVLFDDKDFEILLEVLENVEVLNLSFTDIGDKSLENILYHCKNLK